LEILVEHKLFLHPEKCEFHWSWIEYLGLVISENKVKMDPVKVARVHEWPTLENRTNVQAFIGFVNFYHRFIQDFSTIARPLFDPTHSDKAWNWDAKKQKAFECLKMAVTAVLVLVSPQGLELFCIEPSSLSNCPERENGTWWPSTANSCLWWNGTMRSMTKRCSLSSARWKSRDTFWKEPGTRSRSGRTTRT